VAAPQGETSVVEREIRVEAERQDVFGYFTDPTKMVRWMGIGATLDPRPGGRFSLEWVSDYFVEGEYVVVEPPTRVVFTWGFGNRPGEENPFPPGASTVEVELVADGDATIVHLTHRVPSHLTHFHELGWENYLGRLAIVAAGGDPGADPLLEFLEGMAGSSRD
jgi:uncharacterized protein YndB with AHSA1/START domain